MQKKSNKIVFTKGQQEAYDRISRFLGSPDKFFLLEGKAGTGKTTMLKKVLSDYKKKHDISVVGITAMHKAKAVLRQSIPFVKTFASAYGYKEVIAKNGNRDFKPNSYLLQNAECKAGHEVFVMDEISTFSQKMVDIVLRETDLFTKIIFVGDNHQLPPIVTGGYAVKDDDKDSPIFRLEVIHSENKYELTEIVRQGSDNPIIEIASIIANEIDGNMDINRVKKALLEQRLFEKNGVYQLPYNKLLNYYINSTEDYFKTKLIAYRNKSINYFNEVLRKKIYNNPEEQIIKGELIMMNDTYKLPTKRPLFVYNSEEYKVLDVGSESVEGFDSLKVFVEGNNDENDLLWFPIVKDSEYERYQNMMYNLIQQKYWKEYWRIKGMFGNYSPGFAITAHKSQGSTYQNVFIDLDDILSVRAISNRRKLQTLYTAITRASDKVFILRN